MRITHICLSGVVTDGFNYQDNMLSKYHRKNGHDVTVITSRWIWNTDGKLAKYDKTNYFNKDGVFMIRLELIGKDNINRKFKRFRNLYKTIEETNPDILFIHGVAFLDITVIVKYLKKHSNVVAYADNHSDRSNSATNWLSANVLHKVIWRHYARKLLPYVKCFYGVLPIRVDFLTKMYGIPKDKCKLLVLGADDDCVDCYSDEATVKKTREIFGVKDNDFFIVSGGKIDAFKKQTLSLMEAVKKINSPRVKLLIFGSVAQELINRVNELADGKNIKYIGWIDTEKSYPLFASSNLVVFPGRHSVMWEEVTALGVPMIVKDWPGTHHIDLGGNVTFLKESSVQEIMKVLLDILNSEEKYQSMLESAKSQKRKEFMYSNIAAKSIQ